MSFGKSFLAAVLAEASSASLLGYGKIDHLFRGSEIEPYEFVKEFVKMYGKLPTPETVLLHTGEDLPPVKEPSAYYHDLLVLRHQELELKNGAKKVHELLQPDVKDIPGALDAMAATVMGLMAQKHAKQIADFREAYDLVMPAYTSTKVKADMNGLQFGWPSFDQMSGGLSKGDLVSFVGRPAAGKTWQMLYGARFGWAKAGKTHDPDTDQSRMFVSMEMPVLQIEQRLAAMQTKNNMNHVKLAKLGTVGFKKLAAGLLEVKSFGAPFYVVDGNLTATVEDIVMMARQLKPAAIFVDGAYLVKHPTERDRYKRVSENADLMKKELAALAPTVCSWQFARTAAKKTGKKGERVDLSDIAYADAIGQVSSIVLGIFEEETVETLRSRKIDVLKGRGGETGEFRTRWDFIHMNFDEIVEEPVENLQFA